MPTVTAFNTALDVRARAIVHPRSVREIQDAVAGARARGLRVAAQATGHNAGAYGTLEDALLVDVRHLQEVAIDAAARRVRVGAGVKWERVSPRLSDLGLAGLHGSSPDVGIAGYSLGGGIGWLARKHGMQANAVTALEVVLADGRHVRADHDHEPDLFWALRGGNGNFGVVTAIEFAVQPIAEVYAGALFLPFERAAEVLHAWAAMLPALPEELMTWAMLAHLPPAPFVPAELRGRSFAILAGAFLGSEADGRTLLSPIRELGAEIDTFAVAPPAVLGDLAMDPPSPLPLHLGHQLLDTLPAAAVDAILDAAGPGGASQVDLVQLRHMGGALARAVPGAGARATLPGEVSLMALGITPDAATAAATRERIARLEAVTRPWRAGAYPNFVEHPADAHAFFDAATWARLRAVKAAYDPENLFRGNHPIPPATAADALRAA